MDRANVFRTMGATSFVGNREENDFYATEPKISGSISMATFSLSV